MPTISRDDASLGDAVLAIRLTPQLNRINAGVTDGYLVLVDQEGNAEAVNVGALHMSNPVWAQEGIFVGGPNDEYLLNKQELVTLPRGTNEALETSRFLTPDRKGFITLYNVGFGDNGYRNQVTTGDANSVTSWGVTGFFESVSQCDNLVVGITNTAQRQPFLPTNSEPRIDALVQLYPKPVDKKSEIISTVTIPKGVIESGITPEAPCQNGISYTFSMYYPNPSKAKNGVPLLRVWNIHTGEHSTISLVNEDGTPNIDPDIEEAIALPGHIVDNTYYFVSDYGDIFEVDLSTGVTKKRFTVNITSPEVRHAQTIFTDKSVFVLDPDNQDYRTPVTFSRYDLTTGERTILMSITGTQSIRRPFDMSIRHISINPEWIKTLEQD